MTAPAHRASPKPPLSLARMMQRLQRLILIYGYYNAGRVISHRFFTRWLIPLMRPVARRRLKRLLATSEPSLTVVIRSTLDMAYPYKQRVHHIAIEIARQGVRVVFITPSTGHDTTLIWTRGEAGIIVTPHGSAVIDSVDKPLYLALSTDATLVQSDIEHVLSRGGKIIYDYIDHMTEAVSGRPISEERFNLHDGLIADESNVLVLVSADALLQDVARRRQHNMLLVTNGVDVRRFKGALKQKSRVRPDFSRIIDLGRPILGYYGAFADWFDYGLVCRLAAARPNYNVVLIGLDLDGTSSALDASPPNLFVLPAMPYEDLPQHAVWFDVCLVPFLINDITLATSPLKIFEYMALARPTVSTNLPECRKYRSVMTVDPDGFADACDRALKLTTDPAFQEIAFAEGMANSWLLKVESIFRAIGIEGVIGAERWRGSRVAST